MVYGSHARWSGRQTRRAAVTILPMYLTPGSTAKGQVDDPTAPIDAVGGAVTIRLRQAASPSSQVKRVKVDGFRGIAIDDDRVGGRVGFSRLTSAADVPERWTLPVWITIDVPIEIAGGADVGIKEGEAGIGKPPGLTTSIPGCSRC